LDTFAEAFVLPVAILLMQRLARYRESKGERDSAMPPMMREADDPSNPENKHELAMLRGGIF
jgi:hypothetical protein